MPGRLRVYVTVCAHPYYAHSREGPKGPSHSVQDARQGAPAACVCHSMWPLYYAHPGEGPKGPSHLVQDARQGALTLQQQYVSETTHSN